MRLSLPIAVSLMAHFALMGAACVPDAPAPTVKPAARCMVPISAIPRPIVGEGSRAYEGRLINHAKTEDSKGRCLQKYARTVSE